MNYYISDLHYFKKNKNDNRDNRRFESPEAMHDHMIKAWNDRVTEEDLVIVLGDLSNGDASMTNELLKKLNGRIALLIGNNDRFLREEEFDRSRFEWIEEYKEIKDGDKDVIMSHYPIMFYNKMFGGLLEGKTTTYMLYGHVHDSMDEEIVHRFQKELRAVPRYVHRIEKTIQTPCQMINCFAKFSDYVPLTLEEWIENDKLRRKAIDEA